VNYPRRITSSVMLRRVALVRIDVPEELCIVHFVFLRSVCRLLDTTKVPSSPIFVTLMMKALSS
jgi:hypothetical protein